MIKEVIELMKTTGVGIASVKIESDTAYAFAKHEWENAESIKDFYDVSMNDVSLAMNGIRVTASKNESRYSRKCSNCNSKTVCSIYSDVQKTMENHKLTRWFDIDGIAENCGEYNPKPIYPEFEVLSDEGEWSRLESQTVAELYRRFTTTDRCAGKILEEFKSLRIDGELIDKDLLLNVK